MSRQIRRSRLTTNAYSVGSPAAMAAAPSPMSAAVAAGTPTGCVRAPSTQYYVTKAECESVKPAGRTCVPRFDNGVWDRFHPYAQDTTQCGGAYPPSIMPQLLNDASLVEASCWEPLEDMSLALMMNGSVGKFDFTVAGNANSVTFSQNNLVQELDMPLMYVYSTPFGDGVMRLSLNLTSGHVTVSFPYGNGPCVVTYAITNIGM